MNREAIPFMLLYVFAAILPAYFGISMLLSDHDYKLIFAVSEFGLTGYALFRINQWRKEGWRLDP